MSQTIVGVLIGVFTSLVAGVLLIWKGDQIVEQLKKLPTKSRVTLYSRAYIMALHSYPYRFMNLVSMVIISVTVIMTTVFYYVLTYFMFNLELIAAHGYNINATIMSSVTPFVIVLNPAIPWIVLLLTVFLTYFAWKSLFIMIPTELLVPYAHRELLRVKECIAKCGTNEQFLEYTDTESEVRTVEDLRSLLILAKTVIGQNKLELADDILYLISEDEA